MSNPAKAFAIFFGASLAGSLPSVASAEPSASGADGRCLLGAGQCAQIKCEWFGDGCWSEKIYELVISGDQRLANRRASKAAKGVDRKPAQAARMPPVVWVSFHIGGY